MIVMGENMKRVEAAASKLGAHAYSPWASSPFDYPLAMRRNERWIKDQIRDGAILIDVGPDFSRRADRIASGQRGSSEFYEMERTNVRRSRYTNYCQEFRREGSARAVPWLN